MNREIYNGCLELLRKELVPAFGCTEPIAIAYASAVARDVLGALPERMIVSCSGNIIKNVKGVIVPATGGLKGIEAAAVVGAVGGDAKEKLEVLHKVVKEDCILAKDLIRQGICQVKLLDSDEKLHIIVEAFAGSDRVLVELKHHHTQIVCIEKNGEVLKKEDCLSGTAESDVPEFLDFQEIYEFAQCVKPEDVEEILDRQITYNTQIAEYGMTHAYGANVGATLVEEYGSSINVMARALPAAGSDARMGGCELPVVINSGSGNQGMTVSLPVVAYARELKVSKEKLYRALCISNLTAIYQKSQIGRLSAYCGAVSAGAGAGAGITYLMGGGVEEIESVVTNTLANVAGILCDGAKASCAAKIASSVEAALMAIQLTFRGKSFCAGDGIVKNDADVTVKEVGKIAREGMQETDHVILNVMVEA
ncbi:MAG TPA: serine dehydratase subunit alpha family protein [Candidatus Scybalocola faecigallinarum]|uniref:UPF0597 protein IAB46_03825 n=1 Tax=Candidatus Scybalocola faecigallinarum TaxID=2840941 RepID=A0A9D1F363_9FIRM|nr:serine dehydratase subunit alpha family protein [Candidatus Scybalocola faecigallinarum]